MALGNWARRVLLLLPVAERGGAESLWLELLGRYDRQRMSLSVVFLRDGPFVEEVKRLGVETFLHPITRLGDPVNYSRTVREIMKISQKTRAEVIFSSLGYGHVYGGMAAWLRKQPSLWWQHGIATPNNIIDRWASRIPAKLVIASSEAAATAHRRAFMTKSEKVRVIYPGVDVERFATPDAASALDLRRQWGIEPTSPIVTTIGRLEPGKGQDDFLRAARIVIQTCRNVKFLVVGSEMFGMNRGYKDELQRMSVDLGIQSNVVFTGFRRDIPEVLAVSDIVVQPALYPESFGLVLVEAAAAGRPVIATDVGGPREVIDHGRTGLLLPPGEPERLARAICDLLNNPDRRREMGFAAARRARERFDIRRTVDEIHNVIEEIARAPSGHGTV